MRGIKSKRNFIIGTITTILAIVSLGTWLFVKNGERFLVASVILEVFAVVNYMFAFANKGVLEELEGNADERDYFNVLKSSHMVLKILNYVLCTGCFVSIIIYAAIRSTICIAVAFTFCAVLVMLFVIMLCTNMYYEKHN